MEEPKFCLETFRQELVDAHNSYRERHGVPALVLDSEINVEAQRWAEYCAICDENRPSPDSLGVKYGELQLRLSPDQCKMRKEIIDNLYAYGKHHFEYESMEDTDAKKTGGFTQVIWKATTKLGIGRAESATSGNHHIVIYYSPKGNLSGEYSANVLRPIDEKDTEGSTEMEKPKFSIETFKQEFVDANNAYRERHGVPALVLDSTINVEAQRWAEYCAICDESRPSPSSMSDLYGEMRFILGPEQQENLSGKWLADEIYGESENYEYKSTEFTNETGGFTQMIWRATTKLGIGRAESSSGNVYIIVNYSPMGNIEGEYSANVLPPTDKKDSEESTKTEKPKFSIETFRQEIVDAHNSYREKHGVPALVLDSKINSEAQCWAEYCALCDERRESPNFISEKYGEIVGKFKYTSDKPEEREYLSGKVIVDELYEGVKYYKYKSTEFTEETGGFTQVVWKETTKLGIGQAESSSGNIYFVVNYSPKGNIEDEYSANVLRPVDQEDSDGSSESTEDLPVAFDEFSAECLNRHNEYRRKHGAGPLILDEWLTGIAQNWAETNAAECKMYHNQNRPADVGENIFARSGNVSTGGEAVDSFYKEIQFYRFGGMGFTMKTGHFTQMVWKSTTKMGVGKATGSNGWTYVVVNYSPAGNVQGQFSSNVLRLGTAPPATPVPAPKPSQPSKPATKPSKTASKPSQSERDSLVTKPLVRTSFKDAQPSEIVDAIFSGKMGTCIGHRLERGHHFTINQYLMSQNRKYAAILQEDGNFVLYDRDKGGKADYASNTYLKPSNQVQLRKNGLFALVDKSNLENPLWKSKKTAEGEECFVVMRNDGKLVAYKGTSEDSGTAYFLVPQED